MMRSAHGLQRAMQRARAFRSHASHPCYASPGARATPQTAAAITHPRRCTSSQTAGTDSPSEPELLPMTSEPSECKSEGHRTDRREHLYKALEVNENPFRSMKFLASGVACIGSGAVVLAAHHIERIWPFLPDIGGGALILAGAVLLRMQRSKSAEKDGEGNLRLPAKKNVDGLILEAVPFFHPKHPATKLAGAVPSKLGRVDNLLDEAALLTEAKRDIEGDKAARALTERVRTELSAGDSPRRIRQRLQPRVWVIDFDTRASLTRPAASVNQSRLRTDTLRAQVDLLLDIASPFDTVVVRITSPGGSVSEYGLASAQLARLKAGGVRTVACVDLVAASGGYMLAAAAGHIVAAPFAFIGSIGVVGGSPNVHRLLEKSGVEYLERTAGKFKRSVNMLTPNTTEGIAKFEQELEEIHVAFKDHLVSQRPRLASCIDDVSTGEAWLATKAHALGLVDRVMSSDEFLRIKSTEAEARYRAPTSSHAHAAACTRRRTPTMPADDAHAGGRQ
uniref:Peptidase S49 domain-containing protein n=1 Tax=Chrysotila carterae TaxID=13221 RepID=A0A7S4B0V7_CHRCT